MHARWTHGGQYQAYLEVRAASKADEVDDLRKRLDDLLARMLPGNGQAQPVAAVAQAQPPVKQPGRKWTEERKQAASVAAKARAAAGAT